METSEIIRLIVELALVSGGGVCFYGVNKRIKNAQAKQTETDIAIAAGREWKEIADAREIKIQAKDRKIDELYIEIGKWRDECYEAISKSHGKDLLLKTAEFKMCEKRGCSDRTPPTGY